MEEQSNISVLVCCILVSVDVDAYNTDTQFDGQTVLLV